MTGRRTIWILASLTLSSWAARAEQPDKPEEPSEDADEGDLAKKVQNPVADLISIPFQDNIDYGIGPNQRARNTLNIQPVIPVHLTESWNLIMRIIVPVVSSPDVGQATGGSNGLGDANPSFFLTRANPGVVMWGLGPTFGIPTATQANLGTGKLSIGPTAVVLAQPKPWTVGVLVNNVWSVAGYADRPSVNRFFLQYFVNYNLPHAWYLSSQPIIVADWKVPSDERWLVPFGAGVREDLQDRQAALQRQPSGVRLRHQARRRSGLAAARADRPAAAGPQAAAAHARSAAVTASFRLFAERGDRKELKIDNDTLVVFASDNGPWGWEAASLGNLGSLDMGSSGPFRGYLGDATEGSVRTFCFVRWPGHVAAGSTSYAMFSEMDFLPTFAAILGVKLPADRPIDGVDQTAVLLGKSVAGARESMLSFIGADLVAVRWKQWRVYFKDMRRTGTETAMYGGLFVSSSALYYPQVFNIEMDPHEDVNLGGVAEWPAEPGMKAVKAYLESVKKHHNPPPPNITNFPSK